MEEDVFKRYSFDPFKLIKYGFIKDNDTYKYKTNILDNKFTVYIEINDKVKGKIIDNEFQEEYTNFRIKNVQGDFVGKVREAYFNILIDIRDKCFMKEYFITPQANELAKLIIDEYGDVPEFLFDDNKNGVFRNKDNLKWYGIIMPINKSKLDKRYNKDIEVLNIKLDKDLINKLIDNKGYFRAYHMNKVYWISISLDYSVDTLKIMDLVKMSHKYTDVTRDYLIPANPKYFDIMHVFDYEDTIEWWQAKNAKVGDNVYIYVSAPLSCICFKCKVVKLNTSYIYGRECMAIKLVKRYEPNKYNLEVLKKCGIKTVRGTRSMTKDLVNLIEKED